MHLYFLLIVFFMSSCLPATQTEPKMKMLYSSLPPKSVAHHLAYYELYPNHPLGQKALRDAWQLIAPTEQGLMAEIDNRSFSSSFIQSLIGLINKSPGQPQPDLNPDALNLLEKLSRQLSHYALKGHHVWTEAEMIALPNEEIDIARGVFLTLFGENSQKIRTYEALIDLMALQIGARLPPDAPSKIKIKAINRFIFDEMEYRFPPHSTFRKEIDAYTFLPSIIDSHRGVCLGVSILYLSVAQRLNLPLEIITPPGHIYVRYPDKKGEINIETTARGIHIDSEEYLSIDTKSLQQRTPKEVLGLSHCNYAALLLQTGEYEKALSAYQKAAPYLPEDLLVNELTGYCYLFLGNEEKARSYMNLVKGKVPDYAITHETMAEEFLEGRINAEGLKAMFRMTDDDRDSLLKQKDELITVTEKNPNFKMGWLHLASVWIELHRLSEAEEALNKHHDLNPDDPSAEYHLASLYAQRLNYPKAWKHLKQAEQIVEAKDYRPKVLKDLRRHLTQVSPEAGK